MPDRDRDKGLPTELSRALLPAEQDAIDKRILELRRALEPAPPSSDDTLRAAIAAMLNDPNLVKLGDEAAYVMASGYLYTVRDQPHWAVVEACELVRCGRAGLNPSFTVKEPEFAIVVRRCTQPYRQQLAILEAIKNAKVRPPPKPPLTREQIEGALGRSVEQRGLLRTLDERGIIIARDIGREEYALRFDIKAGRAALPYQPPAEGGA